MIIYVDTRQKKGKHEIKHSQLEALGHTLISKKLDCADYCSDNSNVVIDTKQDMDELYLDLFSEHARFAREIRLAQRQNKKLIILVEDDKIKSLSDVKKWKSKRGKANGTVLFDKMMKLKYAYDVDYRFCSKENAGLEIVKLLVNYSEPI